jgi:hypothetical protein
MVGFGVSCFRIVFCNAFGWVEDLEDIPMRFDRLLGFPEKRGGVGLWFGLRGGKLDSTLIRCDWVRLVGPRLRKGITVTINPFWGII